MLVALALVHSGCAATAAARPTPEAGSHAGKAAAAANTGLATRALPAPTPDVTSGGLSAASVRAVVHAHAPAVEHCYDQILAAHPKLHGTLVVLVGVASDGSVHGRRVDPGSELPAGGNLAGCVLAEIARWKFPKPADSDDVELVLPFVFAPKPPAKPSR